MHHEAHLAVLVLALAVVASGCGGSGGAAPARTLRADRGLLADLRRRHRVRRQPGRRFDEDGAAIARDSLRPGMVVEVEGGDIGGSEAAPTAQALRIRTSTELVGWRAR